MGDLISIILPVYNSEPFLKRTLESLKAQTYTDIEILCINDGSTDGSQRILEKYASDNPRFRIFNQDNGGAGRARNVGLDNMRGKYLMFCDSDDRYEPTMCEEMIKAIQTTNVDFVECCMSLYITTTNPFIRDRINFVNNMNNRNIDYFITIDNSVRRFISPYVMNKIFKYDKVNKFNIRFPEFRYAEDDAFMIQYITYSDYFYMLKNRLYIYTTRKSSQMDIIFSNVYGDKSCRLHEILKSISFAIHAINNQKMLYKVSDYLLQKLVDCTVACINWWGYNNYNNFFDEIYGILKIFNNKEIKKFTILYLIRIRHYKLAYVVLRESYPVRLVRSLKRFGKRCKQFINHHILLRD